MSGVFYISEVNCRRLDPEVVLTDAVVEAARTQFGPILMLVLIAMLGMIPAARARGIGSIPAAPSPQSWAGYSRDSPPDTCRAAGRLPSRRETSDALTVDLDRPAGPFAGERAARQDQGATGKRMRKVAPRPTAVSTDIWPPWFSTTAREMARPRPKPRLSLALATRPR